MQTALCLRRSAAPELGYWLLCLYCFFIDTSLFASESCERHLGVHFRGLATRAALGQRVLHYQVIQCSTSSNYDLIQQAERRQTQSLQIQKCEVERGKQKVISWCRNYCTKKVRMAILTCTVCLDGLVGRDRRALSFYSREMPKKDVSRQVILSC